MRKLLTSCALATAVVLGAFGASTASASAQTYWHHGGGWHHGGWGGGGPWYHGGGWHNRSYGGGWHHHDNGAAIAAGIGGLALGAIVGGALASGPTYYEEPGYYYERPVPLYRVYPARRAVRVYRSASAEHIAACARHYRTYNPRTDTFIGNDHRAHYCRY
ncbi:BA14K family protein [Jiella sp. M17.18]|uniref:BA14K family protein n=1 Tax=Jiella sp. M17.18 TaxID=3234247 RepID=UPI0034DE9118